MIVTGWLVLSGGVEVLWQWGWNRRSTLYNMCLTLNVMWCSVKV